MSIKYEVEVGASIDEFAEFDSQNGVLRFLNERDFTEAELRNDVKIFTNYIEDSGVIDEVEIDTAYDWLARLND